MTNDTREALADWLEKFQYSESAWPYIKPTDRDVIVSALRASSPSAEREALEAALKTIVRSFHRNACYPDAMDGEVDFVVQSILSTVESAALRRTVAETGEPVARLRKATRDLLRWMPAVSSSIDDQEEREQFAEAVHEVDVALWEARSASPAAPSPAVERDDRAAADRLERLGSRLFELEEIASGATGANPMQRGIARDAIPAVEQLIAMEEAALAQPATAEETAPGFVKFVQEP